MTDDLAPQTTDPSPATDDRQAYGLGRMVAGVILVMVGIAWMIEAADWADVPWQGLLAAAVIVVGIALMFGARTGSHSGLIGFGIALAVLLSVSSAIAVLADIPLTGGIGEQRHRPIAVVSDEYRWGIGSMTLDLRDTTADLEGLNLAASVGIGELIVYLPDGVSVEIDAHAGIGEVRVFGEKSGGLDSDVRVSGEDGALVLDLDVAIGKVVVRR